MGFLTGLFEQRASEQRGVSLTDADAWRELGWSGGTATGISVTPGNALKYTAVYACVRIISETLASLPLVMFERLQRGKQRARDHYLYRLLHDGPNPLMTSFQWRETAQAHILMWGNSYNWLEIDGRGQVEEIWPLLPNKVHEVKRIGPELWYWYELPNGRREWYPGWRIWHIPGLGYDGLVGYSPITMARQAIGLGMAAEEFGARFFGNDARPGGILEHPGTLSKTAHERLRESWNSRHQGLARSHRIGILEEGMKYNQIGIPAKDAQFLETRVKQDRDVFRIYRVPPHKAGDLEKAAFSNIEQQSIEFVTDTMRPWMVRWEQSIQANLLTEQDRGRYFAEHVADALLRGDIKTRYEAYALARNNGWMNADDIRELENQNPLPNGQGQIYLVPLNMVPADQVTAMAEGRGKARLYPDREDGGEWKTEMMDSVLDTDKRNTDGDGVKEIRARRSVQERRRAMLAYRRLIADVAGRVLRREANDVGNQARKLATDRKNTDGKEKRDVESFREWVESFYREHEDFVFRQMLPVMLSYGEQVAAAAGDEAGQGEGVDGETVERFTRAYVGAYASRHVQRSLTEIDTALAQDDAAAAMDVVTERWRNERPDGVGQKESTRMNGAMARMVFAAAGVLSMVWVDFGESCPYCKSLSGKRVGVAEVFLGLGQSFQPEGAERPLQPNHDVKHPPVHDGCDCMITVG